MKVSKILAYGALATISAVATVAGLDYVKPFTTRTDEIIYSNLDNNVAGPNEADDLNLKHGNSLEGRTRNDDGTYTRIEDQRSEELEGHLSILKAQKDEIKSDYQGLKRQLDKVE